MAGISTQGKDPETLFTKLEMIGKGSFGEVFKGWVSPFATAWGPVLAPELPAVACALATCWPLYGQPPRWPHVCPAETVHSTAPRPPCSR